MQQDKMWKKTKQNKTKTSDSAHDDGSVLEIGF